MLEKVKTLDGTYAISPITLCELFRGAFLSQQTSKALFSIQQFMQESQLLDFDTHTCTLYGEHYAALERVGKRTQDLDLLIAANALAHGATIVTKNTTHFENVKGLRILAW